MEQIGTVAGFVLTLMIFSYILGDNFLYRLAVYVFVGMTAGFVAIVTIESVIAPWLLLTVLSGNAGKAALGVIPFLLGLLLLYKTSSRLAGLSNLAIAFVIGVGTAVSVVGAVVGTLLPLSGSTATAIEINLVDGIILFVGVASTLIYFQYLARRTPDGEIVRSRPVRAISAVGQVFVVVTMGAIYGGAILTSITIFAERVGFILSFGGG